MASDASRSTPDGTRQGTREGTREACGKPSPQRDCPKNGHMADWVVNIA
jgi:hypothetical protein